MRIYTATGIFTSLLTSTVLMLPSPGLAEECNINAKSITGTYGFATSGEAFANNALNFPVGKFALLGTLTQFDVRNDGSNLTGKFSALLQQTSQTGEPVTSTLEGNLVVSKKTCTGQFYFDGISSPAVSTVFVDQGNEQQSIFLTPGVVLSFPSTKRLVPVNKNWETNN